jgi:hypothetical protein
MTGPVQSRVAKGVSGSLFTFTNKPVAASSDSLPKNWSKLPTDNIYRKEWDAFALDLASVLKRKVDGQSQRDRPLILDAIKIYHAKIMTADARGVEPRASSKMDAAREAVQNQREIEQARPKIFAPKTSKALSEVAARNGALTGLATSGIKTLASDPSLAQTAWGASLQATLSNIKTQGSFLLGLGEGVFSGGKDMVVGLATFAGKVAQFGADNSPIGYGMDALRSALPNSAQTWMKDNAFIPSAERGAVTRDKIIDTLGSVKDYIANSTPEKVGNDIKGFVEKNWDALKSSHAAAVAKGPEAEARWWGQVTGRAVFEIASNVVPVTKVATALKAADKLGDVVQGLNKVDDVAKGADKVDDLSGAPKGVKSTDGVVAVVTKYAKYLGDGPLFRGDRRAPAEIFRDGFRAKGGTDDLADYVAKHVDSNYVSTSTSIDVANRPYYTGGPGGWVYDIDVSLIKSKAIDVNKSLGKHDMDFEAEIAINGGVPKEAIRSARQVMEDGSLGREVRNPNYVGGK